MNHHLSTEIAADWYKNKWVIIAIKVVVYLSLSTILLSFSWNLSPDMQIDYGEQLYAPWRITQGEVMYRDMTNYYFGPFSFYLNALWFYLFGTGISTLIIVNLILVALLIFLLEDWLSTLSDSFSASVAISFFITTFAFSRYVGIGNYNYLTPYNYGMVHGLIIILAMLYCFKRWIKNKRSLWLLVSGILFGLTPLIKIELFVAAVAGAATFLLSAWYIEKWKSKSYLKYLSIFITASVIPSLITVCLFSLAMPLGKAVSSIFLQFVMIFNGGISGMNSLKFYQGVLGTDNIGNNLLILLKTCWLYINVVLAGIFLVLISKESKNKYLLYIITGLATSVLSYFIISVQVLLNLLRPLPLIMAGGFIVICRLIIKKRKNYGISDSVLAYYLASFSFAGTLLLKIFLNTHIYHYGFALAMPATMLLLIILVYTLPKFLDRYGTGWIFKAMILGLLLTTAIGFAKISTVINAKYNYPCCPDKDGYFIKTDPLRGVILADTMKELEQILKPDQTFSVLPRGMMLNYLLRHRDPTHRLFIFGDLLSFDEQAIIDDFSKNPPDYIVFEHLDTTEQGVQFFGKDIGVNLNNWILQNYHTVWHEGDVPFQAGSRFGVIIAEKNKPAGKK